VKPRVASLAAALGSVVLASSLAACSGDSSPSASSSPTFSPSYAGYTTPGADTALGASDEPIPTKIPEALHVGTIPPITADQVMLGEGTGWSTSAVVIVDPKTGKIVSTIGTASNDWDAIPTAFVGTNPWLPYVLGAEVWHTRGTRGKAEYTLSYYSGTLTDVPEIDLPDDTRMHARVGSKVVTSDGRYFVTWDDLLYGVRVVDLKEKKETGKLRIVGCGPFTWAVGHNIYSICENTKEIIQIGIDSKGVPKVTARKKLLPADVVSDREATFADQVNKAMWISPVGEAYVLDFSNGMPTTAVTSAGNVVTKGFTAGTNRISPDGTRAVVSYQKGNLPEGSVRAEGFGKLVVYDTTGFKPVTTITPAILGGDDVTAISYNTAGTVMYVLASSGDKYKLVGFDAKTGKKVSSVAVAPNEAAGSAGAFSAMWSPQQIK
jgi:hypothetical protein